jgi:hypothetical protein
MTEGEDLLIGPNVMEVQCAWTPVITTELATPARLCNQDELLSAPLL